MKINKNNLPLYIALSVPVLMIVLVAAFIYLPAIGHKPEYNFLYTSGANFYYPYGGEPQYQVSGNHLIQNSKPTTTPAGIIMPDNIRPRLYVYDVDKNTTTEISFQQAQSYQLSSGNTSPDGYIIEQGNSSGNGGLLFGGVPEDYNSWFIKGHNRGQKLNLQLNGENNFQFLGWME